MSPPVACGARLELSALPGIPLVRPGDDLARLIAEALPRARITLTDGDVIAIASKVVSRAEGRYVDLAQVSPSGRARELARATRKDPRLVEVILGESAGVSRAAPDVLIVRHRLGHVMANAGVDLSNARPPDAAPGSGPWALLLPEDPDASAERIRAALGREAHLGVVISDSFGRPFRLGTVGVAVGIAGIPALWDRRGDPDLCGRTLEHTVTALADQIAAAADLVAGQADEARAAIHVRGISFPPAGDRAHDLCRPRSGDLYA